MFDGIMAEQFYQFLATGATTTTTTASSFPTYLPSLQPSFDTSYHLHHSQFFTINEAKQETTLNPPPVLTSLHDDNGTRTPSMSPEVPWSNDEMLALLRIRSSMDNTWLPHLIWDNVSRKLAEVGFERSAEKCKEKFEAETRSFSSSIVKDNNDKKKNTSINYRSLFGELEDICNDNNDINIHDDDIRHQQTPLLHSTQDELDHPQTSFSERDECPDEDENKNDKSGNSGNDDSDLEDEHVGESEKAEENTKRVMKKRKRQKKFEMFRGFCEKIVNKMMDQQEQLYSKFSQDMVKRDEEKIAKEEGRKKQEFERLRKRLEVRAHEQEISGDRQAKIIDCLNKFCTSSNILGSHHFLEEILENLNKVPNNITLSNNSSVLTQSSNNAQLQATSSCAIYDHNHTPLVTHHTSSSNENLALLSPISLDKSKLAMEMMPSSSMVPIPQHPSPLSSPKDSSLASSHKFSRPDHASTNAKDPITNLKTVENQSDLKPIVENGKSDNGRRWPRDEVLALINIRCSLFNNNGGDAQYDGEAFSKGPLWERISHKMMELGYKRSAKRCKEKWENINKYFRRTKDMNKKRSIDSRTCPYFHQLYHLYSQGTLMGPTDQLTNPPVHRKIGPQQHSKRHNGATNTVHATQDDEVVVHVPGFDFE